VFLSLTLVLLPRVLWQFAMMCEAFLTVMHHLMLIICFLIYEEIVPDDVKLNSVDFSISAVLRVLK